eukprot:296606-Pyramimonas_sp.AAC.1
MRWPAGAPKEEPGLARGRARRHIPVQDDAGVWKRHDPETRPGERLDIARTFAFVPGGNHRGTSWIILREHERT